MEEGKAWARMWICVLISLINTFWPCSVTSVGVQCKRTLRSPMIFLKDEERTNIYIMILFDIHTIGLLVTYTIRTSY